MNPLKKTLKNPNRLELKKTKWKKIDPSDPIFSGAGRTNYGVDTDVRNADKYIYR